MNDSIYQIMFLLSALICFSVANYVIIDIQLKKYIKNKIADPIHCVSIETHNFVNNKCKYCHKTINELMKETINNNYGQIAQLKKGMNTTKKGVSSEKVYDLNEV